MKRIKIIFLNVLNFINWVLPRAINIYKSCEEIKEEIKKIKEEGSNIIDKVKTKKKR